VAMFNFGKGQLFLQESSGPPVPRLVSPFAMRAQIIVVSNGVNSAQFSIPARGSRPLSPLAKGYSEYNERHSSLTSLNNNIPNGTYTFSFMTIHDGITNQNLSLNSFAVPSAPQVANFTAAQSIDATSPFTLIWGALSGASTNDLVIFSAEGSTGVVFSTSFIPGASNALNGAATSLEIPANRLPAGRTLVGRLIYFKIAQFNYAYSNAVGYVGNFSQTDFPLRTAGVADNVSPVLVSSEPPTGSMNVPRDAPLRFTFNEPMRTALSYSVGGTTNSTVASWSADQRTITITSQFLWPSNTTLTWLLNPATNPTLSFADASFNLLLPEPSLIFTTANGVPPPNPSPAVFDPPKVQTNFLQLTLRGEAYRHYDLERVVILGQTNWVVVQSSYSSNGVVTFLEPIGAEAGTGYYRGVSRK
jgi:hypothetical protein